MADFAKYFNRSPKDLDLEAVRQYQLYLAQERKLSPQSINTFVSAVQFVYLISLQMPWDKRDFPRARLEEKLPVVLAPDEVQRFLDQVTGVQHRAVLLTAAGFDGLHQAMLIQGQGMRLPGLPGFTAGGSHGVNRLYFSAFLRRESDETFIIHAPRVLQVVQTGASCKTQGKRKSKAGQRKTRLKIDVFEMGLNCVKLLSPKQTGYRANPICSLPRGKSSRNSLTCCRRNYFHYCNPP